ncbi:MAG TPA: IS1595 family transposase [Fimbriimonas sp.]|nr:IS1595 family transposase [Fimbriimonas sp.]
MHGIINPESLLQATRMFDSKEKAHEYLTNLRWPDGKVPCPECGGIEHWFLANQMRWKCKSCKRQFSVKVGTIFEDSPIGLDKWLIAVWLITDCKNGISSCELARDLKVTQKTAWFMNHRIRLAMKNGSFDKLCDDVEVDETGLGGLSKNMHKHVRARKITAKGFTDKTVVMGMLERGGNIKVQIIANTYQSTLHPLVKANVLKGSNLYADAHGGYRHLDQWYTHQIVDHSFEYVRGQVHTNGLENFWSLLKRTVRGTYVSVEPFHLHRYLDEYTFRFNERKTDPGERFATVLNQIVGRRLTYNSLIGKELAAG